MLHVVLVERHTRRASVFPWCVVRQRTRRARGAVKSRIAADFSKTGYAFLVFVRFLNRERQVVGMFDAQDVFMFTPENRALRALLWLVIILVPGGLFLFALLAADAAARRLRSTARSGKAELPSAPLSGLVVAAAESRVQHG